MADDERPVDLFGEPFPTKAPDPRGRKSHRRSAQLAEKVAVLKATGSSNLEIALLIGLSEPTLRKYYFRELEQGSELIRQVLNEKIFEKAMGGTVGAQRLALELLEKGRAVDVAYRRRPDEPEAKPERLGKKAERQAAAEKVAGLFSPGQPPAKLAH
ncbi:MAG: hypothetical protein JF588_19345 [Caulobacterales bacterium]|nr:hypothetical protein [Caulobacterales bacterium]